MLMDLNNALGRRLLQSGFPIKEVCGLEAADHALVNGIASPRHRLAPMCRAGVGPAFLVARRRPALKTARARKLRPQILNGPRAGKLAPSFAAQKARSQQIRSDAPSCEISLGSGRQHRRKLRNRIEPSFSFGIEEEYFVARSRCLAAAIALFIENLAP